MRDYSKLMKYRNFNDRHIFNVSIKQRFLFTSKHKSVHLKNSYFSKSISALWDTDQYSFTNNKLASIIIIHTKSFTHSCKRCFVEARREGGRRPFFHVDLSWYRWSTCAYFSNAFDLIQISCLQQNLCKNRFHRL